MRSAVLVIDVQQGLCSGRWAAWDIAPMLARINAVTAAARAAGCGVVLVQHDGAAADDLLAPDSPGWQLAEGLQVHTTDHRLRKTACDAFHETPLQALLQRLGVAHLVVCGLQTEFCVDTTVRRALALGYPVTLVADGHSTLDNGVLRAAQIRDHHNTTLASLDSFGPRATPVPAAALRFAQGTCTAVA